MKDRTKTWLAFLWLGVSTCLVLIALVAVEPERDVAATPPGPAHDARCYFPVVRKRPSDAAATPAEPVEPADNFYCYVCHVNFKRETLAMSHQPVGVGCETCHGMSDEHSADEDGLTPPEKMYPKDRINPYCMGCHSRETGDRRDKLAGDTGRGTGPRDREVGSAGTFDKLSAGVLSKSKGPGRPGRPGEPVTRLCTDCHGKHRLKVRTRVWDRRTGKLISDDGVRMMYEGGRP